MTPSPQALKEAKDFTLRRMEIRKAAESSIEKYMTEAARMICDIAIKYSIPPKQFRFSANRQLEAEVNAVMEWLRKKLTEIIEQSVAAASEEEEDRDDLLAFMATLGSDHTIPELVAIYTNRFKYELEAFIAAGLAYGLSKFDIVGELAKSLSAPYLSSLLQRAFKDSGFRATRITSKGISYGKGKYVSSKNALTRLQGATAGIVWWWWQGRQIKQSGAEYFYQMRGSSYPCSWCDSLVGIHPIEEINAGYPHANCYCIRIPITDNY
jgi:hypothetical protein